MTKIQLISNDIKTLEEICSNLRQELEDIYWDNEQVFWDEYLCGACGVAAYTLTQRLIRLGYDAKFCWNSWDGHCFTEIDGYILDVTATQYGAEPICIIPIDEICQSFWEKYIHVDIDDIDDIFDGWPYHEHPKFAEDLCLL